MKRRNSFTLIGGLIVLTSVACGVVFGIGRREFTVVLYNPTWHHFFDSGDKIGCFRIRYDPEDEAASNKSMIENEIWRKQQGFPPVKSPHLVHPKNRNFGR
jgi:hypothetical protein